MAKKTRKVSKQASQQRAIQQAVSNVNTATTAAATAAANQAQERATTAPRAMKVVESTGEEYKYVKADLRRIGILAVSFTAILVALSFIIH
jgi:hypothetical protein